MSATATPLRAVTIRFTEEELELLSDVQTLIEQIAGNNDIRVTQRGAVVSALKLYQHEKTRRSSKTRRAGRSN